MTRADSAVVARVLYGSETGTAQDVAEQIWKGAKRKGLPTTVSSLEDYDTRNLTSDHLVIFVVATTGQGDPPANMLRFWRLLLRKNLPANMLQNLRYGVLGLGDSSYQKFNFAAKKLNRRLAQLGGEELLPIGLADDQHNLGIDVVVDPWIKKLWDEIGNAFNVPVEDEVGEENSVIERYDVAVIETGRMSSTHSLCRSKNDIYAREALMKDGVRVGTVVENKRTTTVDHFQDVRLIRLQADGVEYQPGDVIYVRPKNSVEQVRRFFDILHEHNVQLFPDTVIQVSQREVKVPFVLQRNLTLGELAEQYWDLNFKPRRSTVHTLSLISENELEKEKLREFASAAGQEELYDYINRPRRNILELLADFPHTTGKLNARLLFEIMSPVKPRAYSIASSSKATPNAIQILVAVVRYKTRMLEPRFGLCSEWLAGLRSNDKVVFWLQKGTFKFIRDKPMILIGPGTGLAPFRSLLLERAVIDKSLQDYALFFGCRNKERDYHCREDLERLSREKKLKVFCAFSRDQENKVYVQHVIRQQRELCWRFLQNGGNIYLAGNSKNMPSNVRDEFVGLARETGEMTDEEAEVFVEHLEKNNRYQCETWG